MGLGEGGIKMWSTEDVYGPETLLYDAVRMDT